MHNKSLVKRYGPFLSESHDEHAPREVNPVFACPVQERRVTLRKKGELVCYGDQKCEDALTIEVDVNANLTKRRVNIRMVTQEGLFTRHNPHAVATCWCHPWQAKDWN